MSSKYSKYIWRGESLKVVNHIIFFKRLLWITWQLKCEILQSWVSKCPAWINGIKISRVCVYNAHSSALS